MCNFFARGEKIKNNPTFNFCCFLAEARNHYKSQKWAAWWYIQEEKLYADYESEAVCLECQISSESIWSKRASIRRKSWLKIWLSSLQ